MVKSADEFYSLFPEKMEDQYSEKNLPDAFVELRQEFTEMVGSGRILDAGCGPGRDCEFFTDNGFEAVGIDVAEGMIDYAKENRKGDFRRMDMRSLEFEDSSFDGIWCSASIYFLPREEMEEVVTEFSRVLKQGGVLYFNFKVGDGERIKQKWGEAVKEYHLSQEEGKELVRENGFRVIESTVNEAAGGRNTFCNLICRRT